MEKRAVIYIRVSDPSQIENNSLEVQEKACRYYAKQKGYTIVEPIFSDEGFSAKHVNNRPGMRQLFQYCCDKKKNVSYVIIYKMDRWSRNAEEGLYASALLAKYGIELVSTTEGIEKTPSGSLLKTILLALSQFDNEMKGERVRDNMQSLYRKGIWCWACPVGYKRPYNSKEQNKGKAPIPVKELRPIIYFLFEKASTKLYSKQQLANLMNKLGFENIFGSPSSIKMVNRIIKNSFYYGMMYCKKWNEYALGLHEAIITEEMWLKANNALFGNKLKYQIQDNNEYPLKSLLKCEICGHFMTSSNPRGRTKSYTHYECGNKSCRLARIATGDAHDQFLLRLKKLKPTKRTLKLFQNMVFNQWDKIINTAKNESKAIEERIQIMEADLKSIRKAKDKGLYTEETAKNEADQINKEIVVLRVEKSDIKFDQYDAEKVRNFTEHFLLNLDHLWLHLEDLPMRQALQNKIFPEGLVCAKNKEIRTVSLSPAFELIKALNTAKMTSGEPLVPQVEHFF